MFLLSFKKKHCCVGKNVFVGKTLFGKMEQQLKLWSFDLRNEAKNIKRSSNSKRLQVGAHDGNDVLQTLQLLTWHVARGLLPPLPPLLAGVVPGTRRCSEELRSPGASHPSEAWTMPLCQALPSVTITTMASSSS